MVGRTWMLTQTVGRTLSKNSMMRLRMKAQLLSPGSGNGTGGSVRCVCKWLRCSTSSKFAVGLATVSLCNRADVEARVQVKLGSRTVLTLRGSQSSRTRPIDKIVLETVTMCSVTSLLRVVRLAASPIRGKLGVVDYTASEHLVNVNFN